jgi:hypothetical protein
MTGNMFRPREKIASSEPECGLEIALLAPHMNASKPDFGARMARTRLFPASFRAF